MKKNKLLYNYSIDDVVHYLKNLNKIRYKNKNKNTLNLILNFFGYISMRPLITVYITNHNYEKFISKSIQSVLNQSFKNYELIIIDDGSSDDSVNVIDKFCKKNKDIIFVKQKKRGLVASNNIAISLAKGKYIMRLDADDWLKKDALKEMFKIIDKNDETAMVFPDYYEVDINGKIILRFVR